MITPANYIDINTYYGQQSPGTVHCANTALTRMFSRQLMQKAMSVYKWTLPEGWSESYILTLLYCLGYFAVIETDKFGVIPQGCTLGGYTVQYQPRYALITNPAFAKSYQLDIDTQCALIKLRPDYTGLIDLVSYYADQMALCAETASVNLLNSKLSWAFFAKNKTEAETYKKAYDAVASGQPAVFLRKSADDAPGQKPWEAFTQNVGGNYIVTDILGNLKTLHNEFCTEIGIPNANTDKRERLIMDEVNANNVETTSTAGMMLDSLRDGCRKAREMFGINLDVTWRNSPNAMEEG